MIMETQNQQPAVNVYPNGGNGGFGGEGAYGGGWFFWIIILFLFAMMMGWGNNGNAAGNGGNVTYVPYAPYGAMMGGCGQNYVQQGFDQAAIMGGLNGIQGSLSQGFANAEVSRCNQQANLLATINANQNASVAAMNGLAMGLQNCCCENRAAVADLKYAVATENCADRSALSDATRDIIANQTANTQMILDKMCQQEIDALKTQNQNLQTQLTLANLAASQTDQTAKILTDNLAQTQALEQYLAPVPRPAYVVQNPNCCANMNPCGCGCGR